MGIREGVKNTVDFFISFISGKMIQDLNTKKSVKIISLVFLYAIIIIGNTYYGQKQVSEIESIKKRLIQLKYKELIYRSDLMDFTKQSSISKKIEPYGIFVSKEIPKKLILKKESHD